MKISPLPLSLMFLSIAVLFGCSRQKETKMVQLPERPNIVIIFIDDMGYGDLGCYGSEVILTPNIDRMADEGTRFTDFYVQPVCGPSRAALLTGRYPFRNGGWRMHENEITFAELLKTEGYSTACIGKWDCSNRRYIPGLVPNDQGFDYYWGPLGANDLDVVYLWDNRDSIGADRNMAGLTETYTNKAIDFIDENSDGPFLLYLAHTMVHVVVDATEDFKGKSKNGLYGDAVEELDFHTGRLLDRIDEMGLGENTLVIFTSDNGPWSNDIDRQRKKNKGAMAWGTSGPLRGAKATTWEGGVRVPSIARWTGYIPAGRTNGAIFSSIDFLPTFASLAGVQIPSDRVIDGVDQISLLTGVDENGNRDHIYYFCQDYLHGVRSDNWKLLLEDRKGYRNWINDRGTEGIELYDLAADIGETRNIAASHPEVVEELLHLAGQISGYREEGD